MCQYQHRQCGILAPRGLFALSIFGIGGLLALLSLAANPPNEITEGARSKSDVRGNGNDALLLPAVGSWNVVPSPNINNGAEPHFFYGVACASASDCWAVGEFSAFASGNRALIEHWDGALWSITAPPNFTEHSALYSVTCTSASNCWAVGSYAVSSVGRTLILHWDGSAWSIMASPNSTEQEYNVLSAVSCVSASDCWAVGYSNADGAQQTLTEHWNGSSWSIISSPNPTETAQLAGIACVSPMNCWSVGYYHVNDGGFGEDLTLIEHWNGTTWSVVNSPNPAMYSYLRAVTCTSASECWAVGESINDYHQTLIERWNGNSWTVVASPNSGDQQDNQLSGVSCVSAQDCWAVGSYTGYKTLVQHWNGTTWSIVASPNVNGANDRLYGVTCPAASNCWAVGRYTVSNPIAEQTLAEQWNGTSWAVVSSQNTAGIQANVLSAVTCTSASNCWAVGSYDSYIPKGVIQHWDGTQWSIFSAEGGVLVGVTCISANDCWAVGRTNKPLTKHWNGSTWALVSSPDIEGQLSAIACTSASNCWAVGSYYNNTIGAWRTLIERWNGTSWSVVSSPNATLAWNWLEGVACASNSSCWAVGWYYATGGTRKTLIERWNGSSWSIATSPSTGSGNDESLDAVSCLSLSDCWAVGHYFNGDAPWDRTLVEQWNGNSWQITASPNTSATQDNILQGVRCASSSQCWAVGFYFNNSGPGTSGFYQTLIEQWNGNSWSIVTSPNIATDRNNALYSVTCVSAADCWAVGEHYTYSPDQQNLVEQFTIPPLVTAAVSRKLHGSAGAFNIGLPGIECRSGGANGVYQLVFSFANNLTSVSSATTTDGMVSSGAIGPNANEYTVNLASVPNAHDTTVTLNTVEDTAGNIGNVSRTMGVLIGDTNGNGAVNSADVAQTKSRIGQPVDTMNFRSDLNANGTINATDVSIIKSSIGSGLP